MSCAPLPTPAQRRQYYVASNRTHGPSLPAEGPLRPRNQGAPQTTLVDLQSLAPEAAPVRNRASSNLVDVLDYSSGHVSVHLGTLSFQKTAEGRGGEHDWDCEVTPGGREEGISQRSSARMSPQRCPLNGSAAANFAPSRRLALWLFWTPCQQEAYSHFLRVAHLDLAHGPPFL